MKACKILILGYFAVGARGVPLEYELSQAYSNNTLVKRKVCPRDDQYCCHRLYDRDRVKERAVLRDFLGLNIPFDNHLVGVRCTPMQTMRATNQECESSTVCCTGGREYFGLVNTYCSPVDEQ